MDWLENRVFTQSSDFLPGRFILRIRSIALVHAELERGAERTPGHDDKEWATPTRSVIREPQPQARASSTTFPKFSW